jgi:tol-pal system protein YbgF
MRYGSIVSVLTVTLAVALATPAPAQQQQLPPPQPGAQSSGAAPKAAPKGTTTKAPPAAGTPAADAQPARPATDGQLRARVEQLEEQLVDLQVTIGTLESLARTTGSAAAASPSRAPSSSFSSADSGNVNARVDGLEIQLRALVGQVEQLNDQVRAMSNRRSSVQPGAAPAIVADARPAPGFGSTTITPSGGDQIGQILSEDAPARAQPAAIPSIDAAGNPKQLYETAYGYLLQQNYGAAETAFEDFLSRHPGDALAGNAQYWLGESHFVRGQYKQAAGAFLKGYQGFARSAKAPDSLLKLAMSLDRLGQREAACTSYGELNSRFPNAPQTVKTRADSERRRIGCP